MKGRLYILGVGPGDPELLTLKAVRILDSCPVWVVPKGRRQGESTALNIIGDTVSRERKEILHRYFPMKKVYRSRKGDPVVEQAWQETAGIICAHLEEGRDVVFPTLGDPAIYSTGFYICETLGQRMADLRVEIVPGVSSIGASAAAAVQPLCLGDEQMVVVPATFENGRLRETLEQFDTVVLMKVHRVLDRLLILLREMDLLEGSVLVERSGQHGQRIIQGNDLHPGREVHYFSTIIVRKT